MMRHLLNGEPVTVRELAERCGISREGMKSRLRKAGARAGEEVPATVLRSTRGAEWPCCKRCGATVSKRSHSYCGDACRDAAGVWARRACIDCGGPRSRRAKRCNACANAPKQRVCARCGTAFRSKHGGSNTRYCKLACANEAAGDARARRYLLGGVTLTKRELARIAGVAEDTMGDRLRRAGATPGEEVPRTVLRRREAQRATRGRKT